MIVKTISKKRQEALEIQGRIKTVYHGTDEI